MKEYEHFGDYMFALLFAPLKKGKRLANQLYIFFKVIGRIFDNLKRDALRVRDEANVATASPVMLPVHGQDRNMPRLAGESIEGYRTRLAMKGIISEKAGIKEGIRYALAALGYENCAIEPFVFQDPERWAEFSVNLGVGTAEAVRDISRVYSEIQVVKEASSKIAGFTVPGKTVYSALRVGGATACIVTLPLQEVADHFEFQDTLRLGGQTSLHAVLPVAEQK